MRPVQFPPVTRAPAERETLVRLVGDLLRRSWRKVGAAHYLDDYAESEWLPAGELRELQLAKLRRLVWHCFLNVPFYASRMPAPSEIERLDGSERLPITGAVERRDAELFVAATLEPLGVERRTAGTMGPPLPVIIDAVALERQLAVRRRAERWAGASRIVALWGHDLLRAPRPLSASELSSLRAELRGRVVVSGPGPALDELAASLDGTPRVGAVIARGGGGQKLAARLGARWVPWYMTAEHGVIAAPCESGAALHVQADHLLVEIVGSDGRALPAGATGRVLVTDLHNYAAPYLRYDVGDRGRLVDGICACGRALPLVELDAR